MKSASLPSQLTEIFTEIIPEVLSEVSPRKLAELGFLVRNKGLTEKYDPLTDSLRKIQWVKLVGLKAIAIEKELIESMEPNTLIMAPLVQTAHALCVTDCLIHTKSTLDSMAVFLNNTLNLNVKGGEIDFKKGKFRRLVAENDLFLKHKIKKLEPWFDQLQKIRDEWIHRSALRIALVHGSTKVGILPIPKKIMSSLPEQRELELTTDNFWSTEDFVEYCYSNLLTLFVAIVDRTLQIEKRDVTTPITIDIDSSRTMTIFPTRVTENMTLKKMKVKFQKLTDW
jgi:hypothetical protein